MAHRGRPRKKITIDDVTSEITGPEKLTVKEIASKYSVSEDTVLRRMKEASKEASKETRVKVDLTNLAVGDTKEMVPAKSIKIIPVQTDPFINGKKVGEFKLNDWFDWIEEGQRLQKLSSWSGNVNPIVLGDGTEPIVLQTLGDSHLGSWGTDHKLMRSMLKEIKETPGLYVALMGDLAQMSIKMRSVLEVSDNLLPPELQAAFLEQMLDEIMSKIAFSSWCNHGVEREESQSGISHLKYLFSRRAIYFNGIGHPDIKVGEQVYRVACSHKFRGNSMYDSTWGPKRYARMEANDREIILQADLHRPAIAQYSEGGLERIAITNGTFQTDSGYAKRYFSLRTLPVMPCLVLHNDKHRAVPFWNLDDALRYLGR